MLFFPPSHILTQLCLACAHAPKKQKTEPQSDEEADESEEQSEPDECVEPAAAAAPADGLVKRGYNVNYYKNGRSVGLKRTHGEKNQFVSFGGKEVQGVLG